MNALTSIPPKVRQGLYWGSFIVGITLGAIQVGFQSAEAGFPVWLKVALSVYAFLAATLGLTAASNTPAPASGVNRAAAEGYHRGHRGATDAVTVLVVAVLVILVLVLLGFIR